MKKLIATLALFGLTSAANAQDFDRGSIKLRDGSRIIRIEVGREGDRDIGARILRLERAVRDLQDRVYDLEAGTPENIWTCKTEAFSKVFYGEGDTRGRAERASKEACQAQYHAMHCSDTRCSND